MDYTYYDESGQLCIDQSTEYLLIPSTLRGFSNFETIVRKTRSGRTILELSGKLDISAADRICPVCGRKMHVNSHPTIYLQHLNFGGTYTSVSMPHNQFRCPHCGATKGHHISFKAAGHRITLALHTYICELLATGNYTNKEVSDITGIGQNQIKEIDLERLRDLYTVGGKLIKPEKQAVFLGIDEFKLHNGHKFATHIIDLQTGHILWIAEGKKKQVVYDFIEHVGLDWMSKVLAVACDMNSDFQEAFQEKCPHIQIVFDHFHIIKNFNEKVVSEVRKDLQRELIAGGDEEGARLLKNSKYILTSNRDTLRQKDDDAKTGKVISRGSELFKKPAVVRTEGYEDRYNELINSNKLLFTCDLVKEQLHRAYTLKETHDMDFAIADIVRICLGTGNKHFIKFGHLLRDHHEGIVSYATYNISSGKMEGINNKIKTLRRHGYGYPDDEYFFLKLFDMSRQDYVRNPKSHRKYD